MCASSGLSGLPSLGVRGEDQAPVAVGPSDREFRVAVERGEDVEDVDEGAEGEAETSGGAAARGWLLGVAALRLTR